MSVSSSFCSFHVPEGRNKGKVSNVRLEDGSKCHPLKRIQDIDYIVIYSIFLFVKRWYEWLCSYQTVLSKTNLFVGERFYLKRWKDADRLLLHVYYLRIYLFITTDFATVQLDWDVSGAILGGIHASMLTCIHLTCTNSNQRRVFARTHTYCCCPCCHCV